MSYSLLTIYDAPISVSDTTRILYVDTFIFKIKIIGYDT